MGCPPAASSIPFWAGSENRATAYTSLFFASSLATGKATTPLAPVTSTFRPNKPCIATLFVALSIRRLHGFSFVTAHELHRHAAHGADEQGDARHPRMENCYVIGKLAPSILHSALVVGQKRQSGESFGSCCA